MFILSTLSFITNGNDISTFILMECLQIVSAICTAYLTVRLFQKLYGEHLWAAVLSLLTSLLLTVLIFLSMETVLAIPLYVGYFLAFHHSFRSERERDVLVAGLIGSSLVLARLDTLLLAGMGLLIILGYRRKFMWWYCAGLLPIILYFISNRVYFSNWLPVSAQVKMLSDGFHFNFRAIEAVGTPRGALYILLTIVGLGAALRNLKRASSSPIVRILLFGFPLLFAITLALRMTWSSYMWYFYPYPVAAAAGLLEIRSAISERWQKIIDRLALPSFAIILLVAAVVLYRDVNGLTAHINLVESRIRAQPNIYLHALGIRPFTETHPGRYAMGDRAGLTAFITGQPILQTEGLAADQAMVDSIREHADLLNVLRKYGVHYYVASYPLREFKERDGHWDLFEPHKQQVQPWAPTMHGRFYAPEVFRYPAPVGAALTKADSASLWVTRILDISQAQPDFPEGKANN